jgi:hypothetical protein
MPTANAELGVNLLVPFQHLDKLLDASGARFGFLRRLDSEEDGVAVLAIESRKELLCGGMFVQLHLKSSGTCARLAGSYAASQRPSALARSTSAKPAGCILPLSMSWSTFSRLTFDHRLLRARGVNFCSHEWSSYFLLWPSIQP